MAKNRKTPDMNLPVWFDGQNINEALFCEEFLQERRRFRGIYPAQSGCFHQFQRLLRYLSPMVRGKLPCPSESPQLQ